jgi:hypothetical protein
VTLYSAADKVTSVVLDDAGEGRLVIPADDELDPNKSRITFINPLR